MKVIISDNEEEEIKVVVINIYFILRFIFNIFYLINKKHISI